MLTHFSEVMMRSYVWELYIGVKMSQMLDIITNLAKDIVMAF